MKRFSGSRFWHATRSAVIVIGLILIISYGFAVTQVNLTEIGKEQRQTQLVRIIRALARPDLFAFDQESIKVQAPILVPCPAVPPELPAVPTIGPTLVLSATCAAPQETITVTGQRFLPNTDATVRFRPTSNATLPAIRVMTDEAGAFTTQFTIPRNRESPDPQAIEAETKMNVGRPRLSVTARETIYLMIETIFMALLATILGTVFAFPLSFLAAGNLMRPITAPFASIMLTLLTLPFGLGLGLAVGRFLGDIGWQAASLGFWPALGLLVFGIVLMVLALRLGIGQAEETATEPVETHRLRRVVGLGAAGVLFLINLGLVAVVGDAIGLAVAARLPTFSFVGEFLVDLGAILRLLAPLAGAVMGAYALHALTVPLTRRVLPHLSAGARRIVSILLAMATGIVYALLIGAFLNWLYLIDDPTKTVVIPAVIGGGIGLVAGLRQSTDAPTPIGTWVYTLVRTILNVLRAIEPLIMVIVFAVWVGIGPFAGVLALSLHTIASLGKLYSEQVESILPGPLEAITATGANRLQTIVYAVIPQIIPPYISFTLYRWDINVRMSTVIGFAGGGGIGFLLQQNINLLQYRQAAVQILAIALVVATLDYVSAYVRERVV
jgi:phosphonate ABC transporter permease subunit PhnE